MQYLINQRSQHYGVTDFVTANDPSVQQITVLITGGWSNTSDWNEYWTDVKAMYDWVVANVEYRSDGLFPVLPPSLSGNVSYSTEMWQFPNETLSLRKGDCEDMAVLLCSMIRYYSNEAYLAEVVLIKSSSSGHSAVQLPVSGGYLAILDPAGQYYTHDGLGDITSKDVSAEVDNWLSYWKSQGIGNDVYVNRVFSSYLDNTFATTGDYTSWMYTR
jgi:transglutaminase-like putative cysteine protease